MIKQEIFQTTGYNSRFRTWIPNLLQMFTIHVPSSLVSSFLTLTKISIDWSYVFLLFYVPILELYMMEFVSEIKQIIIIFGTLFQFYSVFQSHVVS
jgi:hypothetical protein